MKEQLTLNTLAAAVLALRKAQQAADREAPGPVKMALFSAQKDHEAAVDRMLGAWQEQQAQKQPGLFDGCC